VCMSVSIVLGSANGYMLAHTRLHIYVYFHPHTRIRI